MLSIRTMRTSDVDQVAKIQVAAWRQAYQDILPAQYLMSLDVYKMRAKWLNGMTVNQDLIRLVAVLDNRILGYAVGLENRFTQDAPAELYALYVDPEYWRHQVGSKLLKEFKHKLLEKKWNSFIVWTLEANVVGRNFYLRQAGELLPHQKKTFKVGEDEFPEVCYLFTHSPFTP